MAIAIVTDGGTFYVTGQTVQDVRAAIDRNEELPVWWYLSHGERCRETMWFPVDRVMGIRTESDDQ